MTFLTTLSSGRHVVIFGHAVSCRCQCHLVFDDMLDDKSSKFLGRTTCRKFWQYSEVKICFSFFSIVDWKRLTVPKLTNVIVCPNSSQNIEIFVVLLSSSLIPILFQNLFQQTAREILSITFLFSSIPAPNEHVTIFGQKWWHFSVSSPGVQNPKRLPAYAILNH